jgi:hypothetical protein
MQSTSSEPSTETTIIRTGSDGRLRYTQAQRGELQEAFDRGVKEGVVRSGFEAAEEHPACPPAVASA